MKNNKIYKIYIEYNIDYRNIIYNIEYNIIE